MDKLLEILDKNPSNFVLGVSVVGVFAIITIILIFTVIKYFTKGNLKLKILGNEIAYNTSREDNTQVIQTSTETGPSRELYKDNGFLSALASCIELSITEGYNGSLCRRELYDEQMDFIKARFENIRTNILHEYMKQNGENYETAGFLLKCAFDSVEKNLKHVCIKDRLNEKTLQSALEANKSIIDIAYNQTRNALIGPAKSFTGGELLLNCFDMQSANIEQSVQICIKHAHETAIEYFNKLQKDHEIFHTKIFGLISPFINDVSDEKLNWNITLPPNRIVGGI